MKKLQALLQQNKGKKRDPERRRLLELAKYEKEARSKGFSRIAGVDEAGRGPLAGPVFAAACIIPEGVYFRGINDSKKLSADKRSELFSKIIAHDGVSYAVGIIAPDLIDRVNIYQASILAMLQAIERLPVVPDCLLVDGLALPHPSIICHKLIGGDALSQSIAAASIIAKVSRDQLMEEFDKQWPEYGFKRHKGYGTPEHLKAIQTHGPCPIHRRSFMPFSGKKESNDKIGRGNQTRCAGSPPASRIKK